MSNVYTITINTDTEDVEYSIEADACSINYDKGVIEAVLKPGHFRVIKLPDTWTHIEATEEVDEEARAAYDAVNAAENVPVPPPVPPPPTGPAGQ